MEGSLEPTILGDKSLKENSSQGSLKPTVLGDESLKEKSSKGSLKPTVLGDESLKEKSSKGSLEPIVLGDKSLKEKSSQGSLKPTVLDVESLKEKSSKGSLEPTVLGDESMKEQSCKGTVSRDNNRGNKTTQGMDTSFPDKTKDSDIKNNSSDIKDILGNYDTSVQRDGNKETKFKISDDKDEEDFRNNSVPLDDKQIQFKVGSSDDDEMVTKDTSQPRLANEATDNKYKYVHPHDKNAPDSRDLNRDVLLPKQDVCSPPNNNHDQTTNIVKQPVKKPLSPSLKQTNTTEKTCINIRSPSKHPELGNPEPVAHTSKESNPLLVQPSSSIEDPQQQTIERSGKSRCNPKPAVHDVPNTNILVACLVTICFNLPLGAVAIYFSLTAAKAYRDGLRKKGASRARTSMLISLLGIVLTVLAVTFFVLWMAMNKKRYRRQPTSKFSLSL